MTKATECTFVHPNGKDASTIDFFLYTQITVDKIVLLDRLEYIENVSDHYPVSLTLELKLIRTKPKPISTCGLVSRVNRKKVKKQQYAAIASSKLLHAKPALDDTNLNKTFQDINKILRDSTKECIPAKKRNNKKPKLKVMSPAIHSTIQEKKKAFYHWKQNGRSNDPSNFYLLEKN